MYALVHACSICTTPVLSLAPFVFLVSLTTILTLYMSDRLQCSTVSIAAQLHEAY